MLVNLCTFWKLKCGLISTAKNLIARKIISKLYTSIWNQNATICTRKNKPSYTYSSDFLHGRQCGDLSVTQQLCLLHACTCRLIIFYMYNKVIKVAHSNTAWKLFHSILLLLDLFFWLSFILSFLNNYKTLITV